MDINRTAGSVRPLLPWVVMAWRGLLMVTAIVASSCRGGHAERVYRPVTGGDPDRGRQVMAGSGCGACHTIPGVRDAHGVVAVSLATFAGRTFIAGVVPNTPENLVQWIRLPQSIEPHTAMPALGLTDQQARDAAAYLYELR